MFEHFSSFPNSNEAIFFPVRFVSRIPNTPGGEPAAGPNHKKDKFPELGGRGPPAGFCSLSPKVGHMTQRETGLLGWGGWVAKQKKNLAWKAESLQPSHLSPFCSSTGHIHHSVINSNTCFIQN